MKEMMKKTMVATAMAAVVFGTMAAASTTVMAEEPTRFAGGCPGRGLGWQTGGMMWDADGNFLTREAFEERLDGWIADGLVRAEDRAFMLERFDWCGSYGGGATGVRGGCGGFGSNDSRGRGRGWN